MKNNILVLSAGRRVELVRSFQQHIKACYPEAQVFCTDMEPNMSAACLVADGYFQVPRVTARNYIKTLKDICVANNIGLVVPTIDTELELLARYHDEFLTLNSKIIISNKELIHQCRDKRKTKNIFDVFGVRYPTIYLRDEIKFPTFCKPFDGSCSIGAFPIDSAKELTKELIEDPKNMFMELIPKSYSEYTVDAYYDRNHNLKCLVPRKRIETRGGEVSKGVARKNSLYEFLLPKLKRLKGAIGCLTIQVFFEESTGDVVGLEINPRFGGGYPLSESAGATFTKWLIQEYINNEVIEFCDDWDSGTVMLRYDAKVLYRED